MKQQQYWNQIVHIDGKYFAGYAEVLKNLNLLVLMKS